LFLGFDSGIMLTVEGGALRGESETIASADKLVAAESGITESALVSGGLPICV